MLTKHKPRYRAAKKKYDVSAKPTWYTSDMRPDGLPDAEPSWSESQSPSRRLGMQRHPATNVIYNMDMEEIPEGGFHV